jgi:hypothetical protein
MRAVEKRLRERLKDVEAELEVVIADRNKFREEFARLFRSAIDCHGRNRHFAMDSYIETGAKFLATVQRWWW